MGFEAELADAAPQLVPLDTIFLTIPAPLVLTCEQIRANLLKTKGILDVKTSSDKTSLVVTFVSSVINGEQVGQMVPRSGSDSAATHERVRETHEDTNALPTSDAVLRLKVEGMTCHSCTSTIEGKVGKLQGVSRIKGTLKVFKDGF